MLTIRDILQPENVSYTDNVWTWAVAHMLHNGEDWQITTITDTAPIEIVFLSKGEPLTGYIISGSTVQDGTPTHEDPVDVVGCGVRTENLLNQDAHGWERNCCIDNGGGIKSNEFFDASPYIEILPEKVYTLVDRNNGSEACNAFYDADKNFISSFIAYGQKLYTATSPPNAKYIRCSVLALNRYPNSARNAMLIEGDTEPPAFIPYGYKLPVTIGGTEYPIYLGQVQSIRIISKMIITGSETNIVMPDTSSFQFQGMSDITISTDFYCTHYANIGWEKIKTVTGAAFRPPNSDRFRICDLRFSSVSDFKNYLVQQYQNGTPVTVFYVNKVKRTSIVNEPLHRIGDYADTISMTQAGVTIPTVAGANTLTIDTTVQPSSMSITGKIREAADV